jgi:hypothetical protein
MKTQSQYCTNIITFITVIAAAGLLSNAYAAKGSQRKALRRRLPYYGVYSRLGKKAGVNRSYIILKNIKQKTTPVNFPG